jgi:enoyl-CoA hydratase
MKLTVNGQERVLEGVDPDMPLLRAIRDLLGLKGTKFGCGKALCGACTVHLDGDGIAVITLGSARRIYFDEEMGDALTEALDRFTGDANVRVVVVTGGAPGYFIRHFSVAGLIRLAESLRASGREWPENATYDGGFFDKAMALCESMSKPVIAAISGTCLAGGFEFALSCNLRIAEDGDRLIGLPEAHLGLLPGAGGTQRLPRTIGTPAALLHILMGAPLTPREAERKGLVHETVLAVPLDRGLRA